MLIDADVDADASINTKITHVRACHHPLDGNFLTFELREIFGMGCNSGLVIYCHPRRAEKEYRCVLSVHRSARWKDGFHDFFYFLFPRNNSKLIWD